MRAFTNTEQNYGFFFASLLEGNPKIVMKQSTSCFGEFTV